MESPLAIDGDPVPGHFPGKRSLKGRMDQVDLAKQTSPMGTAMSSSNVREIEPMEV
ncbi:MAG: hypothetical protein VX764_01075 [Planctomycetota bacterium]|nr:hypothetical protein [Planctomycetota bacterium]